ncbi:MAG: triple tyrosine motif-containing protein [Bacteroidales bacterium]|jgi:ligand-binding sensor domain-containing protein/DNA-binding CsgD family transcriptional regulator|nr:triple tyrosine motif-containing protein [Bacteroidales bacterium]
MIRRILFTAGLLMSVSYLALFGVNEIGTPYIRNFKKSDYNASTQNWSVAQDAKGFMYFANNDGLLVYDGVQWQLFRMPNLSMVRSIFVDNRGDIYIGAYNDIGKMVASPNGRLTFSSLKDFIPEEYRNFDDVWNIFAYKDKTVFQSYYSAFFYKAGSPLTVVQAPSRFQNSYSVRGRLIFNDFENGLMEYDETRLVALKGCESLTGIDIWSILPFGNGNEILICTLGSGLFIHDGKELRRWNIPASDILSHDQIFSATVLHDNQYAIGTILNGLLIIDGQGNIILQINKKKGLQNNTVLDLLSDRAGNLWLALDNGIDYLAINSPVTFIQSSDGFGAGYASVIYEGRLYIGTNQGLYVRDWSERETGGDFRMISGTYGQVWYLGVHKGILICGHNNGTYVVKGETASLISRIPGGWKYHELARHPGYLIGGTYSGVILFRWEQNTWKYIRQLEGINESFRVFEEDEQGDIWMSHGFKGIFRVGISDDLDSVVNVRFYNSDDGLPSDYYLGVQKVKGKLIITSETEIFEYSQSDDGFVRSVYFNQLLSPVKAIAYLKEDTDGNIWYVAGNRLGVFRLQEDYTYQHVTTPFLLLSNRFIHGFESIYLYSPEHIFIGTEDGFAHYSSRTLYRGYQEFSAYITKGVAIHQDSVFYFGTGSTGAERGRDYSFVYRNNNLRFTYASPVYDNALNTDYSYRLLGYDDKWSPWSKIFSKEYSNLPDDRFTFQVKARNQLGIESLPDSLEFTIKHPWYKSPAAYLSYFVGSLAIILLVIRFLRWRIEVSNRKERMNNRRIYEAKEQEYIRQALESDKEIIRIRNEKLYAEMILRDKELANQAMNMVRKNEFLISLKDEMKKLSHTSIDETLDVRVSDIIARITREVDSNKQREVFETAFDEVHEDFLERLKSEYPRLTPTELRLCGFLKMNMSTKEIAPLMNISVRGVEICRYRVRKKMGISRDTNLTTLLLSF